MKEYEVWVSDNASFTRRFFVKAASKEEAMNRARKMLIKTIEAGIVDSSSGDKD